MNQSAPIENEVGGQMQNAPECSFSPDRVMNGSTTPESSRGMEVLVSVEDLKDQLESKSISRGRVLWGALLPGIGATGYFLWTASVAASPVPSMTLAMVFGGAVALSWRRYSRLGAELLAFRDAIRRLEREAASSAQDHLFPAPGSSQSLPK